MYTMNKFVIYIAVFSILTAGAVVLKMSAMLSSIKARITLVIFTGLPSIYNLLAKYFCKNFVVKSVSCSGFVSLHLQIDDVGQRVSESA
jgi:hypothetical protein